MNLETAGYTREQTSLNMRRDLVFGSSRVSILCFSKIIGSWEGVV